ncbi:MAG: UDP-N-acetylmuramate--L-alanine ligase [Bacteroidota bacterium]
MNVFDADKIYFLGIGGIGMSALARYFHLKGKVVEGYDRASSVVTRALEELGIKVFYELDAKRIEEQEVVVYTPAIKPDNAEHAAALEANIPMFKRSQVLGQISQNYKTIAVAGTHGKTTTSTMMTHVLRSAGLDVTAFLGGISLNLNSNFVYGESEWLVVEADEYDRSFLTLKPEWAIVTSLDPDHLDIYGTAEEMKDTYRTFSHQANHVLAHAATADFDWKREVESYGPVGTYKAGNLRPDRLHTLFDFASREGEINNISLPMPGYHNVSNMTAALSIGVKLGLNLQQLKKGVESFQGIYRRFEVQYHADQITFVDDYAHHPSEIEAVISTARHLFPERKLIVVFQPHLFTRTRDFQQGFAQELSKADACLLLDIYPAREKPIAGVTSQALLNDMTLVNKQLVQKNELPMAIGEQINRSSILLTLGAGDIDREVPKVKDWILQEYGE